MSPWGNLGTKLGRKTFRLYLEKLTNAERLSTPEGIRFLRAIGTSSRTKIYKRLREVDPKGYKKLITMARTLGRRVNYKHQLLRKEEEKKIKEGATNAMMVVDLGRIPGSVQAQALHFCDDVTPRKICAFYMASGYTVEETSEETHIPPEFIKANVSLEDIRDAQSRLPQSIVKLAEKKIAKDLLSGCLDKSTMNAEKIVMGRRQLALQAREDERRDKMTHDAMITKRKSYEAYTDVTEEKDESSVGEQSSDQ